MNGNQTQRLDYLDAMRGFAMIIVVVGHIFLFSFDICAGGFVASFLCGTLELPLFFMISGYCAADLRTGLDYRKIWNRVWGRIPKLLISAFLFMAVYCVLHNIDTISSLLSTSKSGYWYTFSMFEFIFLYTIFRCIAGILRIRLDIMVGVVIVILILIFPFLDTYLSVHHFKIYCAFSFCNFIYFFGFLIGVLIRCHSERVRQWLSKGSSSLILILSFVLLIIIQNATDVCSSSICAYLIYWPYVAVSLVLILGIFQNIPYLSADNHVGRYLKFAGRHTLEIYFLHYYFIFNGLTQVGEWFVAHPSPTLEFVCALAIALVVVAFSLALGRVLRLSPWISENMLGAPTTR